jgi:hypothetical protein
LHRVLGLMGRGLKRSLASSSSSGRKFDACCMLLQKSAWHVEMLLGVVQEHVAALKTALVFLASQDYLRPSTV